MFPVHISDLLPLQNDCCVDRLSRAARRMLNEDPSIGRELLGRLLASRTESYWKSRGLEALMDAGCRPYEADDDGDSLLAVAVRVECDADAIELVVRAGANPNGRVNGSPFSSLHDAEGELVQLACQRKDREAGAVAACLMRHGGRLPDELWLEICGMRGGTGEFIGALLMAGADPFCQEQGSCLRAVDIMFDQLMQKPLVELAPALVAQGEELRGGSILHAWIDAAIHGRKRQWGARLSMLKALLAEGADWDRVQDGQTAKQRFLQHAEHMWVQDEGERWVHHSGKLRRIQQVPELASLSAKFTMEAMEALNAQLPKGAGKPRARM